MRVYTCNCRYYYVSYGNFDAFFVLKFFSFFFEEPEKEILAGIRLKFTKLLFNFLKLNLSYLFIIHLV